MLNHGNQSPKDAGARSHLLVPSGSQTRSVSSGRQSGQERPQIRRPSPPVILSFGAGVNSVDLLLKLIEVEDYPDLVLFADTGDEMDEALEVVQHTEALCSEHGIEFATVRREGPGIVQWHKENRVVPLPHRGFRACTEKFKVAPIRKALRDRGINQAMMLIGIAKDEAHRMKDSNVKWITNEWPLVYRFAHTRQDCIDTISQAWDGPEVKKSGCKGCPFIGPRGFLQLCRDDRAAFDRWRDMEESARDYPKNRIFADGPTLAEIAEREATEQTLDAWTRPSIECGVGSCSPDQRQTKGGAK